jgi:hypothetical protein
LARVHSLAHYKEPASSVSDRCNHIWKKKVLALAVIELKEPVRSHQSLVRSKRKAAGILGYQPL